MFNYDNACSENCGKIYQVANDIYETPFFTKDYCNEIILFLNENKNLFFDRQSSGYGTSEVSLSIVSNLIKVKIFYQILKKVIPSLRDIFPTHCCTGFLNSILIRYSEHDQQYLNIHEDTSGLSFLVKLNDEYEGGETVFPRQHYDTSKLETGNMIIWPGQITHPHKVSKVTKGTKYSMSIWSYPVLWSNSGGSDTTEILKIADKLKL